MTIKERSHHRRQLAFRVGRGIALCLPLFTVMCGRTDLGLLEGDGTFYDPYEEDAGEDADDPIVLDDAGDPIPVSCVPSEEVCNGVDDDCDGDVDEVPSIPCPGGGERYCVAGRMSKCPQRCETCIPGSERICQLSYCLYWGVQTCAADGRSFGVCREAEPPPECKEIAEKEQKSAELEQCCLDAGYCCLDLFDLDHDNNTNEMLGECEEVVCG